MSLPKKDMKVYFEHDVHAAIKVIAECEGLPMGDWIAEVITDVVAARIHKASLLIDAVNKSGIARNDRD